jgi:ATP-dependent Lhr-like helicase
MWTRLGVRTAAVPDSGAEADPGAAGAAARARLARKGPRVERGSSGPSRATPVSFVVRDNLDWLLAAARGATGPASLDPTSSLISGRAGRVLESLRARGALFFGDLVTSTGLLRAEVEDALWELVAHGVVTADGFGSVRALLSARGRWDRRAMPPGRAGRLRRAALAPRGGEGRWSLLTPGAPPPFAADPETLAEAVAEQLLARWGVLVRDLLARETLALPWREIQWALRRLEARGVIRGGRFVTGFVGEQYALPDAVEALRETRRRARSAEPVRVAGVDPLNLVGILTPGPRVPALRTNAVTYVDGLPVDTAMPRAAVGWRLR